MQWRQSNPEDTVSWICAHLDVAFSGQDFSDRNRLDKLHETWNDNNSPFILSLGSNPVTVRLFTSDE